VITVLSGTNYHAVSAKVKELTEAFEAEYGSEGIERRDASSIEPSQLASLLTGVTLFASHRLVIIKDLSASKHLVESFLQIIKNIPEAVRVVILEPQLDKRTALYKALKKDAELLEYSELDEVALSSWVRDEVGRQKGNIDAKALQLIVQYVGLDQGRMLQELNKLLAYDSSITTKAVEELVEPSPQDTIFQLLDLALGGKSTRALEVLDGLERAHEDPFQTASMLIWQVHILALVQGAGTTADSEIAKEAKINPFVIRKSRGLAKSLTKAKLTQIIDAVAACDVTLKTSSTEPWRVIEQTILAL